MPPTHTLLPKTHTLNNLDEFVDKGNINSIRRQTVVKGLLAQEGEGLSLWPPFRNEGDWTVSSGLSAVCQSCS